jgi:hypothetical protein
LANNRRSKRKVRDNRKRRKTTFCFAPSASQAALLIQLCHRKCRCGGASSANRPNSVPFSGSLGEEGSGRPFIQLNSNRALSSAVIYATRPFVFESVSLRPCRACRGQLSIYLEIGTKKQERAGFFLTCARCENPGIAAATAGSSSIGPSILSLQISGRWCAAIHARSFAPRGVPHSPGAPSPGPPERSPCRAFENFAITLVKSSET